MLKSASSIIRIRLQDERYKKFHGRKVHHPFGNREIPIVTDEMVEMDFGTGAVKITPAHDANDYEVGNRHNLPFLTVFTGEGLISPGCGQFSVRSNTSSNVTVLKCINFRE